MPRYYANVGTSGAYVSTIQDMMAKFVMMMNAGALEEGGRALRTDTTDMMLTSQNDGVALDFDSRIGFIWELTDPDLAYAGRLCWKDGAVSGFHCQVEILRDYKLGVVVCANDEQVPFMDIAKQALKLAFRDKTGITPPPPFVPAYSPRVSWDQTRLDALQGVYVFDPGNSTPPITVQSVPGAIEWTNASGKTNHMVPRANGWLSTPASQEFQLEFSEVSGKKVIVIHVNGQSSLYAEYCILPTISAAWQARIGTYQATNWAIWTAVVPIPSMTLVIQNGVLLLSALSQFSVCWFRYPTPLPTQAAARYRSCQSLPTARGDPTAGGKIQEELIIKNHFNPYFYLYGVRRLGVALDFGGMLPVKSKAAPSHRIPYHPYGYRIIKEGAANAISYALAYPIPMFILNASKLIGWLSYICSNHTVLSAGKANPTLQSAGLNFP